MKALAVLAAGLLATGCGHVVESEQPVDGSRPLLEARYRDAAWVAHPHLAVSTIGGVRVVHAVYASDEYCGEHECGNANVAYRSSIDNFATRVDVTTHADLSAHSPQVAVTPDGVVHVFYISNEQVVDVGNLAVRTLPPGERTFGARRDLTTATAHAGEPAVAVGDSGTIYVAYTSAEYCANAGCDRRAVAVRSSSDGFFTRTDVGAAIECSAYEPQIALQKVPTESAHLFWSLTSHGACTATYRSDNAALSSVDTPTTVNRIGASSAPAFTVRRDGTPLVVYYSHAGWHAANSGCPWSWQYYYTTPDISLDNYAARPIPGACGAVGYPDSEVRASLAVDDADVVHLAYPSVETLSTQSTNMLVYRTSVDVFTSPLYVTPSRVFGSQQWTKVAVDAAGGAAVATISVGNRVAGLNVYDETRGFVRQPASAPTTGSVSVARDRRGGLWIARLSQDYCETVGCTRSNVVAHGSSSPDIRHLTRFEDESTELGVFRLLVDPADGALELYYDSNEESPAYYNLSQRRSLDEFSTRVPLTTESGNHTILDDLARTEDGTVHVVTTFGKSVSYSTVGGTARVHVNVGGEGGNGRIALDSARGLVGIVYGGNEIVGWTSKVRSSADAWASVYAPVGSHAWAGRAVTYGADGQLILLYASMEGKPGVWNFSLRSSADGYVTRTAPFEVDDGSLGACLGQPLFRTGPDGVLHLLYATAEAGGHCNVAYRSSVDWGRRIDVTRTTNAGALPLELFLEDTERPIACVATNFVARCGPIPLE